MIDKKKCESKAERMVIGYIEQFAELMNTEPFNQYEIFEENDPTTLKAYVIYRLDFALPEFKINIEIDGEDYHDKEKDKIRDAFMNSIGWDVIRIPAGKCNMDVFSRYLSLKYPNDLELIYSNKNWFKVKKEKDDLEAKIQKEYMEDQNRLYHFISIRVI